MEFLNFIGRRFDSLKERRRNSKLEKRTRKLDILSCETINVMEFNGRLYVAFDGVPIVRVDDLKVKTPELLAQSREDFLAWKAKFDA